MIAINILIKVTVIVLTLLLIIIIVFNVRTYIVGRCGLVQSKLASVKFCDCQILYVKVLRATFYIPMDIKDNFKFLDN